MKLVIWNICSITFHKFVKLETMVCRLIVKISLSAVGISIIRITFTNLYKIGHIAVRVIDKTLVLKLNLRFHTITNVEGGRTFCNFANHVSFMKVRTFCTCSISHSIGFVCVESEVFSNHTPCPRVNAEFSPVNTSIAKSILDDILETDLTFVVDDIIFDVGSPHLL